MAYKKNVIVKNIRHIMLILSKVMHDVSLVRFFFVSYDSLAAKSTRLF